MSSGKRVWQLDTGINLDSALAIGRTVTFSEMVGPSRRAVVRAVDAATGSPVWNVELGEETLNVGPLVGDEAALLAPFSRSSSNVTDATASLIGLDPDSGDVLWKFERKDVLSPPIVDDEHVYITSANMGETLALSKETGSVRWKFSTGVSLADAPVLAGGVLVSLGSQALYGLNAQSGDLVWRTPVTDQAAESLSLGGSGLVVLIARPALQPGLEGMVLRAFDSATGREIWSFARPFLSGMNLAAGTNALYVSGSQGVGEPVQLYALNIRSGHEVWRIEAEIGVGSPYPTSSALIAVATTKGSRGNQTANIDTMIAIDEETGDRLWEAQLTGQSFVTPVTDDELVIVGTTHYEDSEISALRLHDGSVVWRLPTELPWVGRPLLSGSTVFVAASDNL